MRTTLFIPVRNEIDGLKLIMPKIDKRWIDEIIAVDGNSTDGTYEYLKDNGYNVIEQKSKGLCGAYWECVERAIGDIVIAFSPDNNSIPELIPKLTDKMKEGYDIVIASRYLDGAKSYDDDIVTGFGNWMFTKMVNIFFKGSYTDTLVMFRAFKKDIFQRLNITEKRLPVLEVQMCIRALKESLKVSEIPGDEPKRIGGVRKLRPLYNGSVILYQIMKELFVK